MISEDLMRLGFTEKEVMIYLLLLRLGKAPVSSLAARTTVKRVTLYSVLESLENKGVVTHFESDRGKLFVPLELDNLLYQLKTEAAELRMKMSLAERCVDILSEETLGSRDGERKLLHFLGKRAVYKALKQYFLPVPTDVLFMSCGTGTDQEGLLKQFFLNDLKGKVRLWASHEACQQRDVLFLAGDFFELNFKDFKQKADLIFQEDRLFFIASNSGSGEVEMTVLFGQGYPAFLRQIIFSSKCT